jgi:hypothetical protein
MAHLELDLGPGMLARDPRLIGWTETAIDLYWLPLGAGGHCVALNGRIYEATVATAQRRAKCALYHSALEVRVAGQRYVIEMAPAWASSERERGVVAEGPVGAHWAGHLALFRYEIRRWRNGWIPDVAEAVASPQRVSTDPFAAQRVLDLAPRVPRMVWGRAELGAGEMWNSNSVVAWLLVRSGIDTRRARLPARGRAPGWVAGVRAAGVAQPRRAAIPR